MSAIPTVSVVIPVYNSADTLAEAMESILAQTYRNFELLILDDGSTDSSADIASSLAARDGRIRLIRQSNQGKSAAATRALHDAAGEFVAIMHSDDIALPQRIEKQLAFMRARPEIDLCGTGFEMFGAISTIIHVESDPDLIRAMFLFSNMLAHSSVMMRRAVAQIVQYDPTYTFAEDYELWTRLSLRYRISNVNEILLRYRVTTHHTSDNYNKNIVADARRAQHAYLRMCGFAPDERQLAAHDGLAWRQLIPDAEHLNDAAEWLTTIWQHNQKTKQFKPEALKKAMESKLALVARLAQRHCPDAADGIIQKLPA